jgi:predicted dehydrogenase
MANRPLNVGLIGGGKGAFIVHPHQRAIHFDGTRRVTAGALFPDPKIALEEAANWPYPIKGYESYTAMIEDQKNLPANERLDYVLIVTPNHVHFDPAMKAIRAGIPVFCEKPLCLNLQEANALVKAVRRANIPFGVAHTYLGHWTTRLSRYIVRKGLLGTVRWVDSYYLQGWLATKLEATGQQQATWRTNPKLAGGSGCGGDIGTHALMQLRYVTGLDVTHVSAQLERFVEGRPLDDHFTIYCQLNNGAKALVRASQICIGYKNDLGIQITVAAGRAGTTDHSSGQPAGPRLLARRHHGRRRVPAQGRPARCVAHRTDDSLGTSGSVPRCVCAPASLLRGRRSQVEGGEKIHQRRQQLRQH